MLKNFVKEMSILLIILLTTLPWYIWVDEVYGPMLGLILDFIVVGGLHLINKRRSKTKK